MHLLSGDPALAELVFCSFSQLEYDIHYWTLGSLSIFEVRELLIFAEIESGY